MGIKVSLIVPVYQAKDYIEECIESLLGQSYENLEIVLVNDGSRDGSGEICDKLEREHDRITVFHQENKGVSAARNVGIKQANGEYLMFVDSDDAIALDSVEKLVNIVEQESPDIVFFDYVAVYGEKREKVGADAPDGKYTVVDFAKVFGKFLRGTIAHNIGTKLYRRDMLIENNIVFDERYSIAEDITFCIEATSVASSIYYFKDSLYFYNIRNEGSLMTKYRTDYYEAEVEFFKKLERFLKEQGGFEGQKDIYYDLYMSMVSAVLLNEFRYGKESMELIEKILSDPKVAEAKKHIRDISIKKKLAYKLIWTGRPSHIYAVFKASKLLRKRY